MTRSVLPAVIVVAAAATVGAGDRSSVNDLEIAAPVLPVTLETAAELQVSVTVHNRGEEPWSDETGHALAYHWYGEDGRIAVWDGRRSPLGGLLAPGESRSVSATLIAPERAGSYDLQWDVVQEGVTWISEVDPTPVPRLSVKVAATHAFTILGVDTPRVLALGGRRAATVVVRNEGRGPWSADGSVALASHWYDRNGEVLEWEGLRTAMPRSVAPGETVELEALVAAPDTWGRHRLQWDMVDDGVCWFSQRDDTPEPAVTVLVVPRPWFPPWLFAAAITILAAVLWRRPGTRAGSALTALADVGWCVAALILKQAWVMRGAGLGLAPSGWFLTVASAALVGSALLLLPVRLRRWTAWMVTAGVTALLFGDVIHERFFGDLGSMAALRSIGQLGQVGDSVLSMIRVGDLWFWADLAVAPLLLLAAASHTAAVAARRRWMLAGAAAALVVGLLGVAVLDRSISVRQVFHTTQMAHRVGVLNLHGLDVVGTAIRDVGLRRLSDGDEVEIRAFIDGRRHLRAGIGRFFGVAEGRNLVMIQVESLQSFVIGYRIGGRQVTPFLNSVAAGGLSFTAVTDQTEEGRSSDSELATQVSLLPLDRGAAAFLHADNSYTGLASVLADRGYRTVSMVPFDGGFWNRRVTHRAYGYEHSLFADDFGPGELIGWGLNDEDFLAQAAERLIDFPEPWCAYLLTLSLHHPFDGFPDHHKVRDVGEWEGTPFGDYLHTMHLFDNALQGFVDRLDEAGLLDRTVLALWGDHDAGFEWRPEIAAAVGAESDAAGWYLSQRVPLVIRAPGLEDAAGPRTLPAGHIDVAPTLLGLLGVDPAPFAYVGRNLLGAPGAGPVVGEYRCWQDGTHLYLRRGPRLEDGECIELDGSRRVSAEACAVSFADAHDQVELSTKILEYDLQTRLYGSGGD